MIGLLLTVVNLVPENTPERVSENSDGKVVPKAKTFKGKYNAKLEFSEW